MKPIDSGARPPLLHFGDPARATELLGVRARSFVARIEGEAEGEAEDRRGERGRWLERAGAHAFDWGGYRCVHGLGPEVLPHLGALLDWYTDGRAPILETVSGPALGHVARALVSLGYQPIHANAVYAAALDELAFESDAASTEPAALMSRDPRDFGRLGAQMWNAGDPVRARSLTLQHQGPAWTCASVMEAGEPVAGASLFFDGAHAFHANALTLETWRGRGLHARLLREQITLARAQGKRWFLADTQVGSGSGRNLERVGLRCVATYLLWDAQP